MTILGLNKDYVKRYGYTGPSGYTDSQSSEIFHHFKRNFTNDGPGGDILPAFQWFMKGRWGQQQRDNGRFFEALFADQEQIARFVSTNPTTFPAELYKGLKNKESVIGIVRQDRGFLHSVSIWGAEFANDGTISALYITDSNDRENEDDVREYDKYHCCPVKFFCLDKLKGWLRK